MPDGRCMSLGCAQGIGLPVINVDKGIDPPDAMALFPVLYHDQPKYAYLAYRYSGFTITESQCQAGVTLNQLKYWRGTDPEFREYELGIAGPNRTQIRKEILGQKFLHNFALVMERDRMVLQKAVAVGEEGLTKEEASYVRRIRAAYTANEAGADAEVYRRIEPRIRG